MTKPKASKIRRPKTKPKKGTKPPSSDLRHSDDLEEGALQKPLGENPYRRRARTHGRRHGTPGRSGTHRTRTRESMSRGSKGGRNRKSRIRGEMGRSGGWTTSRRRRKKKKKPKGVTKYAWKKVLKERKKRKKKHYSRYRWYWGMISQLEAETNLKSIAKPRDGTFLVRSQMYQQLTRLVITIMEVDNKQTKIHHLILNTKGPNWQLEKCSSRHKTVVDLVRYYRYHRIRLTGLRLKHTVRQPEWMLRSYHIVAPRTAKVLGAGNFSDVIVGAYCRRLVAIKRLTSKGDQLMKDREALMKEAMFMVKLEHPYITKLIGISVDKLPPMLLVELMAAGLDSHLRKHGAETTFEEKMLYCLQLAKGMTHMAKMQVVHRDLAARNALFSRYGILKISDFGLSEKELNVCMVNVVREKLPCAWMAPESLADLSCSTFSEKTDVWGFAVTCVEIFENGLKPLRHINGNMVERLVREGNAAHARPKKCPREVIDFLFDKCMNKNPELRPSFAEILTRFDLWIKMKYFPPPIEKRTVCKIKNCTPLTMAEYEILFANNMDWLPEVRRGHHKKKWKEEKKKTFEKKRKRLAKIAKLKKKNPRKVLRKLRRRLRMRRKRMKIKKKLRIMRRLRTEEKTRIRLGRENAAAYKKQRYYSKHRRGMKRIRQKFQKLVALYKRLMHVKFRKRMPNRPNRKRLRRTRMINKKSKHPASRNGKAIRVKSRKIRVKKAKYPRPKFPNIKKFAKKPLRVKNPKKKKLKVVKVVKEGEGGLDPRIKRLPRLKKIRDRKVRRMLVVKTALLGVKQKKQAPKAKLSVDPKTVRKKKWLKKKRQKKWKKLMKKKKRRKKKKKLKRRKMKKKKRRKKRKRMKKHKRRRHRRRNRRRHRKWRRIRRGRKKRQRIREKHQRKCIRALTIAQKERWLDLSKRRRERMRMMHRRKRRAKIARILKRWRLVRMIMWKKRLRQMTRRKERLAERLKKREEKRKEKQLRKVKKLERKKQRLEKKLAKKQKKKEKKMKRKKKKERKEQKEKEKKKEKSNTTIPGPETLARRAAREKRKEERRKRKEERKKRKLEHAKSKAKKATKKEKGAARRRTSAVKSTRRRSKHT